MQLGMNSNIERMGKTLHVQTEDSGHEYGHIITHLFLAGSIIATERIEYDNDSSADALKALVREQHQQMLNKLNHGLYDKKIMLSRPKPKASTIPLARTKSRSAQVEHPTSHRSLQAGGPWVRPEIRRDQAKDQRSTMPPADKDS